MAPIVNGLEAEYGDRIVFQSLDANTPEGRKAMQVYHLRGHPTMVLFDAAGAIAWQSLGVQDREVLLAAIEAMD